MQLFVDAPQAFHQVAEVLAHVRGQSQRRAGAGAGRRLGSRVEHMAQDRGQHPGGHAELVGGDVQPPHQPQAGRDRMDQFGQCTGLAALFGEEGDIAATLVHATALDRLGVGAGPVGTRHALRPGLVGIARLREVEDHAEFRLEVRAGMLAQHPPP